MNGQKSATNRKSQEMRGLLDCILSVHEGPGRLHDMLNMLMCLQQGKCSNVKLELSRVQQCLRVSCFDRCISQSNPALCLRTTCLTQGAATGVERTKVERPNPVSLSPPKRSPQRHRPSREYLKAEKRYRLGLYDCISSYCGELHGESRKSCIINYCHRSSTLQHIPFPVKVLSILVPSVVGLWNQMIGVYFLYKEDKAS